jgi:hypothetical protein
MDGWTGAATAAGVVTLALVGAALWLAWASHTGRMGRWGDRFVRWRADFPRRHPHLHRWGWVALVPIPPAYVAMVLLDLRRGGSVVLGVLRLLNAVTIAAVTFFGVRQVRIEDERRRNRRG